MSLITEFCMPNKNRNKSRSFFSLSQLHERMMMRSRFLELLSFLLSHSCSWNKWKSTSSIIQYSIIKRKIIPRNILPVIEYCVEDFSQPLAPLKNQRTSWIQHRPVGKKTARKTTIHVIVCLWHHGRTNEKFYVISQASDSSQRSLQGKTALSLL